jgi:25S rRNA (uracil2634-N3)-methyltransferase
MSVLTLGDGDLTFSLAIARIVLKRQETKHGQGKVIASSYESLETLRGVYPKIDDTINELKALGAQVHYEVDATRIMETIPGIEDVKFHRIAWNFPCTAAPSGQDGQNEAMDSNKELVRKFVVNAQSLLCNACGEISMCHKTKPPYNQWQLETVALEQCANKMRYLGRIVLDKTILPPYTPRKALDKKSFACHDACIFVFGMDAATNLTDGGTPTFSSTIPLKCEDKSGILENSVISPDQDDMAIIPVGPAMLRQLRQLHLNERELTKSKQKNRNAQRNEVNRFSGGFNSQKRLKHF